MKGHEGTLAMGGSVGPRVSQVVFEKKQIACPSRVSKAGPSSRSLVIMPTTVLRLLLCHVLVLISTSLKFV